MSGADFKPKDSGFASPDEAMENTHDAASHHQLWPDDPGTLDLDTRRVLLALIRGPYVDGAKNGDLWKALLQSTEEIRSRLADLFLDLIIDADAMVAFVQNVKSEEQTFPKAARHQTLNLYQTVMVLYLRREMLTDSKDRVYIGREELFDQMATYRDVERQDDAAFRKKLMAAWRRLIDWGLLHEVEGEDRCEISPVLPLVFGVEESQAVAQAFETLRHQLDEDETDDE